MHQKAKTVPDIWFVLKKIKDKLHYLGGSTILVYGDYCGVSEGSQSLKIPHQEMVALGKLQSLKVITIFPPPPVDNPLDADIFESGTKDGFSYIKFRPKYLPYSKFIKVEQPRFDKFYSSQEEKIVALEAVRQLGERIILIYNRTTHKLNLGENSISIPKGTKRTMLEKFIDLNRHPLIIKDFAKEIRKSETHIKKKAGELRGLIDRKFNIPGELFLPYAENGVYTLGEKISIREKW